jgi:hypothetical protein
VAWSFFKQSQRLIKDHELEKEKKTFLVPNAHEISTHYIVLRGIPENLNPIEASKELKIIFNRTWSDHCLDVKIVGNYYKRLKLGKEYDLVQEQIYLSQTRENDLDDLHHTDLIQHSIIKKRLSRSCLSCFRM